MKTKRVFSLLMGMAIVLMLFPTMVHADGLPASLLVQGRNVKISSTGTYIISGATKTASSVTQKTANPFTDVKSGDWFFDNVMYVYKNGLMNGATANTFHPTGGMTRGMFVTVLYRLSGDTGSYTSGFSDVPSGVWCENAVAWAAQNGIAGGVGDNRFAPNAGITREQLAVLLYNYAKYKGYDVSAGEDTNILSYKDALSISEYAFSALQWACVAGIMKGRQRISEPERPRYPRTSRSYAAKIC